MLILFSAYQVSNGREWAVIYPTFYSLIRGEKNIFVEIVSTDARLCGKDGRDSFTRTSTYCCSWSEKRSSL